MLNSLVNGSEDVSKAHLPNHYFVRNFEVHCYASQYIQSLII